MKLALRRTGRASLRLAAVPIAARYGTAKLLLLRNTQLFYYQLYAANRNHCPQISGFSQINAANLSKLKAQCSKLHWPYFAKKNY